MKYLLIFLSFSLFCSQAVFSNAPESIVGYSITFNETEGDETSSYGSDGKSHDNWGSTAFSYEKLDANTSRISYEEDTAPEIETLTFTSASGGTFAWVEYEDTTLVNILEEGSGTFTISQDVEYAPESIVGYSITFNETEGDETSSYGSDGKSHDNWGSTAFSYEKLTANTGRISYEEDTAPEIETLTFTSASGGTFAWVEYEDTNRENILEEGSGTFTISQDVEYAPESIVGYSITFNETEGNETSSYGSDGKSHDNWGSTAFSYEKLTANTGRISYEEDTAPEIETLTFTSASGGTFAWVEYEDTNRENILEEGSGTFTISQTAEYAPSSLVGKTIHIPEESYDSNYYFTEDEVYYVVPDSNLGLVGISYTYVANTSTTATLTLARESGDVIHQISFSSATNADSNWSDSEENGSATLQVHTENYLPSSLAGLDYNGSSMNDTLKFIDDSNAVFYDESDSNFSNRELSNITYTWEQIGPRIGKLTTSLGEETLLFFESNTSGLFDWEETGSEDGNSGQFNLYYYPVGKAFESLVGSSITIGDTTYVFTSPSTVTVHSPSGTSSQEYSYLRENEDEALLSVGSTLYKLDFYNHQYGRIIEGGSGYFSIHQNWATKGWVYYDDLPWIYSNNQGDWMYQILSDNNATNTTELMYLEPWSNLWSQNLDLNFTDQRVFSADSQFYWEDYDDFNNSELNSSKWDVAWWDGGTAPSIDPNNDQVVFNKGNTLIANLSDLMNTTNSNAESSYSVVDPNDAQPHSLLELKHSSEIHGIEFELMIPNDSPDETCIGLYAIDYNQMFNATTEADEMRATKFELDLCYFGSIKMEYYYRQPETYEENKSERDVSLGEFVKAKFEFKDENIIFYINDEVIVEYPLIKGNEVYVFRAMNEQNLDFSAYLRNVKVLRKKSYPQGWMWTDYYPWAYSHETGGWLYFELAKDTEGNPVMNYYDHKTGSWDLYGPSLNQFYER